MSKTVQTENQTSIATQLKIIQERFPDLARRLENFPAKDAVTVFKAQDKSVCYGIRQGNRVVPVMDHVAPTKIIQAQLDRSAKELSDFSRPVLIVGLYPGNELLGIFDLCEKAPPPRPDQQIYVCIDSTICLYAFLKTWDASRVLASPRVHLFWHEDMSAFVDNLKQHPETPHIFTLITGANDTTLNVVLPPLGQLVAERDEEIKKLKAENNAYYDSLDDQTLADIISHKTKDREQEGKDRKISRKPRLMMPTCSWSTFIQHSARDTCASFEAEGWETRMLKMDAMLTPYYLVKSINEFKPDVFLFIDHLRSEAEDVYPRNMMFITWIQDEMDHLFCLEAGQKMTEYAAGGKRDLVIGYTERLDKEFGYPPDRLVKLNIPADPHIFHPVKLTDAEQNKYSCELAFMSNVSTPSEIVLEQKILPAVEPLGISRAVCEQIHDSLWEEYRSGKTLVNRQDLLAWLNQFPAFAEIWQSAGTDKPYDKSQPLNLQGTIAFSPEQEKLLRLFFWRLNDTIYRHIVLEWADNLGIDLRLYGHGWENHPRFKKYAQGPLEHGPKLNTAYQAARFNLHLNITPGMHQRIWEILSADAQPLIRAHPPAVNAPPDPVMRKYTGIFMKQGFEALFSNPDDPDFPLFQDWVFRVMMAIIKNKQEPDIDRDKLDEKTAELALHAEEAISNRLISNPAWIVPDWETSSFTDYASFAEKFRIKT